MENGQCHVSKAILRGDPYDNVTEQAGSSWMFYSYINSLPSSVPSSDYNNKEMTLPKVSNDLCKLLSVDEN